MSRQDSTTTMAAAKEEDEKSVTKVFSMIDLDDGLIILEDGKRMPSEIYEDESITENIKRLKLENKDLENMLCSLQTTIDKVSEELNAKLEKYNELSSRQREHPEVVRMDAVVAEFTKMEEAAIEGKKQMELDKIKRGQKLTRLKHKHFKVSVASETCLAHIGHTRAVDFNKKTCMLKALRLPKHFKVYVLLKKACKDLF